MDGHKYNTRARRKAYPEPKETTTPKTKRRKTLVECGLMRRGSCSPCRRNRSRSRSPLSPLCIPCPSPKPYCFNKFIKYTRIGLLVGLLILFVWYSSDRTYHVLRKELDTLNCHISSMEDILQKSSHRKGAMEQQLHEITETLPQIKEMARSLREDIDKCRNPKVASGAKADLLRNLIRDELEQYNADKTGRTDYALESSGGQVLHIRDTKSFSASGPTLSLFGIPLCQSANSPRALIQPGVMPGECWAFKGSAGSAVVKLIKPITVTGVSIEHISRNISPTGSTNTAPKEFSIFGLEKSTDTGGYFFGKYTYNIDGPSVQYFPVHHKSSNKFEIVELKVHSNHGHPEYTCVYRLRVHGDSSTSSTC